MFLHFSSEIRLLPGIASKTAFVLLLAASIPNLISAQPCSCNHTITNQQLAVNANSLNILPGDTICIQAGTRDYLYLINFHGDSLHYLVFINCGGAVIVQNNFNPFGIKIANSSFFRFTGSGVNSIKYGIRVLGTTVNSNGVSLDEKSTNFEVDHLEVANTGFAGIMSKTDPVCDLSSNRGFFTQYHTVFHDNYIHNNGGEGFYIGHSSYNGFLTNCNGQPDTLYPHEIKGLRVYNNIVENSHLDGIQIGCATEDCEIYGNTVTGYGASAIAAQNSGIQLGGGTTGKCYNNFLSGGTGTAIMVFGTGNNIIFNNIIYNIGLTFFPDDPTKRVHGIFVDDRTTIPGRYFNLVNNTIVNVKTDGIRFSSLLSANNKINNNLIIHPGSLGSYSVPALSYIYLSSGVNVVQSNNYTNPFMTNVHFRDTLAGNFRLRADSPARDMGTDVSLMGINFDFDNLFRPYTSLFDIGGYEYHPENLWTGAISSSWDVAGNWSKADIPFPDDDVVVSSGTPHPLHLASTGKVCHYLVVCTGAILTLESSAEITITGNLTIQQGGSIDNHGIVTIKGNLINQNL
ncbi:MAG: right-handed parallel beta-helix repeat-containing protein [Bacteroidota bacterium]